MKFHFTAYALCLIEVTEDLELDIHEVSAELLGFFASRLDAEEHRDELEAVRLRDFNADRSPQKIMWRWTFMPRQYVVVPISDMRFESLADADQMISEAAVLIFKGCGVQHG